jgi:hypothetical protein
LVKEVDEGVYTYYRYQSFEGVTPDTLIDVENSLHRHARTVGIRAIGGDAVIRLNTTKDTFNTMDVHTIFSGESFFMSADDMQIVDILVHSSTAGTVNVFVA